MPSSTDRSLEALRKILLQEDELKLQELETELLRLRKQISDKEALIESLDPVIADLLERKIASSKQEMAAALAPVMSDAISHQIAEAKDDVVDALYPIIGKTIRKSVAEAMKKLVESINQRIEQTLRRSFFKKRLQAKITGVPESELVLKDSLPFKIEQIFLIHKDSGLLLSHVAAPNAAAKVDEELISGMLTAIRNFVAEAFSTDHKQDLNAIQYGDLSIIVEPASYFYLALVTSGIEPAGLKDDIQQLNRKIHNRFYRSLRYFDGDITQFGEMPRLFAHFIQKYEALSPPQRESKPLRKLNWGWLKVVVLIAAVVVAVVLLVKPLKHPSLTVPSEADSSLRPQDVIKRVDRWIAQHPEFRDAAPKLVFDAGVIVIEGTAPSQKIKRELGFLVSEISQAKVIVNNMEIDTFAGQAVQRTKDYLAQCYIHFPANQAVISDHYRSRLDSIVTMMNAIPDVRLIVKGYSDNSATHDYNLRLSQQRAQQVAEYLMQHGLDSARIGVEFYGEADPIAGNDTEMGRAKNRRVAFDVVLKR